MSININVNGMKFTGQSFAERAEYEKRSKNRLLKVREKSKEIAQDIRDKVRLAKEEELKKLQQIKEKELNDWKRTRENIIQDKIDCCIRDFGNAHIAAIDASCEEGDSLRDIREEQDLMAATRGRVAMLQEQRRREKEAEQRLQMKKRKQQKTIGIQADFLTQHCFSDSVKKDRNIRIDLTQGDSDEDEALIAQYSSKPNIHKHQSSNYDPQNYTSNSVDSNSNSNDSDLTEEAEEYNEESLEFNQITNLLKQRMQEIYDAPAKKIMQEKVIEIASESSSDIEILPSLPAEKVLTSKKTLPIKRAQTKAPQKSILKSKHSPKPATKKSSSPHKKIDSKSMENNRVRYLDIQNKYESSYMPRKDLVIRNEAKKSLNAKVEAQIQTDLISKKVDDDILKQLNDIRSHEALEKEKIRRDYEKLRLEMDEIAKQEQELRVKTHISRPLSRDQLLRQEENRQRKMNEAVEKAFEKNIITCPPVAREKQKGNSHANEVNVATNNKTYVNNLVKTERLKDLLEKINHQKRLILNELEKNEDIPGPDLQRVMEYLKELEQEKAKIDSDNDGEKSKKLDELNEREQKIREREIRLENKLRELFNKQLQKEKQKEIPTTSSSSSSSGTAKEVKKITVPPVEILIKVQNPYKSPRKKKKTYRCLDTLSQGPKKVYPKTPIKKKQLAEEKSSAVSIEPPIRPILKRTDDNSSSTSYRSIPDRLKQPVSSDIPDVPLKEPPITSSRKPHHKLNPALMHYITRLLGMNTNIGNQLNVDVSSVATPGSSTMATSGNNSAILVEPSNFDNDRLEKLQQFIDDNYSFLSEVNETIKSVEREQINDKRMDTIWRDALNKKKPKSVATSVNSVKESAVRENRESEKVTKEKDSVSSKKTSIPSQSQQIRTTQAAANIRTIASQAPSTSKQIDASILTNFTEYTANCHQRISALSQMLEQVQRERLKLIENSLSSGEFNNFTEYREIVQQKIVKSDQKDSSRDDPPSEEINNILQKQTRPFGVSKDSGISGSRPVTSSDFRDSPDTRVISEEPANLFKPIKAPKMKVTVSEGENEGGLKDASRHQQKPQRPPLSLKSFSPAQVEKQHEPHELSTIAEIETPTASKVNIIPDDGHFAISNVHSFPNFEEYAKNVREYNLTIEQEPFPELGDLKDALPDMNVKTYVDPNDFNLELTKDDENKEEIKSNNSSIPDIMEELKRRNIISKPFAIIEDDPIEQIEDEKTTPTATIKLTQPQSPRRPAPQSRIIIKTPDNGNTAPIQIEIQQTPTKKKQPQSGVPQPESPKSNDTLSGIQEIEKDLQGAGMSWAASLLKRSAEAKKQRESSSSSDKVEIEIQMPDSSSSSSSGGRPINLRDFLRRELMAKSQKDKYLSDESSLSSQFMRSLLNVSSGSTSSDHAKKSDSSNTKLRTSTPVNMKSSDKMTTGRATSSQALFGPEADSVSTLKDSGSSDDKR